eukprot:Colp12_sorted_trinity150504_noHs@20060
MAKTSGSVKRGSGSGFKSGGSNIKKGSSVSKSAGPLNRDRENRKKLGGSIMRDRETVDRLKMYKSGGKIIRDKDGRVLKEAPYQSKAVSGSVARVQPDRRWFGNTHVIGQKQLEAFREVMAEKINDPYQVVIRQNKLPMSLIQDSTKIPRVHLLDTESYDSVFSKKTRRKKPKLEHADLDVMATKVEESAVEDWDEVFASVVGEEGGEIKDPNVVKGLKGKGALAANQAIVESVKSKLMKTKKRKAAEM